MFNNWRLSLALVLTMSLSACVTTTDSEFASKADPEAAVAKYVQLGSEYLKRNDVIRARRSITRALEIDDENASAHATLGLIYHQEGENKRAEEHFTQALEIDPSFTRGRTFYAAFLFSENRVAQALTQFELASQDLDYAKRAQVFTNIALCHTRLENRQKAIEAYDRALRLDRVNGRALSGITELLIQERSFPAAQQYYNRLLVLIKNTNLEHTASSLWMGVRIANFFGSPQHASSYGALLAKQYPNSPEYQQYRTTQLTQ